MGILYLWRKPDQCGSANMRFHLTNQCYIYQEPTRFPSYIYFSYPQSAFFHIWSLFSRLHFHWHYSLHFRRDSTLFHFGLLLNHWLNLISCSLIPTRSIFLIDWLFLSLPLLGLISSLRLLMHFPWPFEFSHLSFSYLILSPLLLTLKLFTWFQPSCSALIGFCIDLHVVFLSYWYVFVHRCDVPISTLGSFPVHSTSSPFHAYHVHLALASTPKKYQLQLNWWFLFLF